MMDTGQWILDVGWSFLGWIKYFAVYYSIIPLFNELLHYLIKTAEENVTGFSIFFLGFIGLDFQGLDSGFAVYYFLLPTFQ